MIKIGKEIRNQTSLNLIHAQSYYRNRRDELTDEEQEAAKVLGYAEESWNADDSDSEGCCGCF